MSKSRGLRATRRGRPTVPVMNRAVVVALVGLFAIVRGVWCALVIPPWQGPDEPMHFVLAMSCAGGELEESARVRMESEVFRSMARFRFWELTGQVEPDPLPSLIRTSAHIPSPTLYHRILGGWLRLTGAPPPHDAWPGPMEIGALVQNGRLLSVLMHGASAVLLFLAAEAAACSVPFATGAALLFLAHPQMTFIGSCLNSDNLLAMLASLTLFLVTRALCCGDVTARVGLVAVCLVAPIAKRSGIALTVTALPVALAPALRTRRTAVRGIGGGAAVLAAAAGALWLAGMGRSLVTDLREVLGLGGWIGPQPAHWWQTYFRHFWVTFWGSYGWVQCPLPSPWLGIIGLLVGTAIVMVPAGLSRFPDRRTAMLVLAVCAVQFLVAVIQVTMGQGMRMELGQGRHAFVGLPGLIMLLSVGVRGLLPTRNEGWALPLVGFAAAVLGEAALWFVAGPCFLRS